jgi:chorismate synthase
MKGREHNDNIISIDGKTETNFAGGINGGITNGNEIDFRVAVKPTSSTHQSQKTLNFKSGEIENLSIEGRHDTCIALRVPVVVEAAASIVMADFLMQSQNIRRVINPKKNIY